jgi:hypothetical protein
MWLALVLFGCRHKDATVLDTAALIIDEDADGFGAEEDCDDTNPDVNPDADELCNGIDDNCDGVIDTDAVDATSWTLDRDGDGFGDDASAELACTAPSALHVGTGGDCDDLDDQTYPDAPERCDELDNNCDGVVDNDLNELWYADADDDTYGDAAVTLDSCDPGAGWVTDDTDCNDADATAFPGAEEVCDEGDNDCDTFVDEGVTTTFYADTDSDGWGDDASTTEACSLPDDHVDRGGDCDDTDGAVSPSATELCDGVDNNCDTEIDEDSAADASTWYADTDTDGWGDASSTTESCDQPSGYVDVARDCDDGDTAINPDAAEVCDGVDNDCNSWVDDDDPGLTGGDTYYIDVDADGHGVSTYTTTACSVPSGYSATSDDCDDTDASVSPSGTEVCNAVDDDCDTDVDEDGAADVLTWYEDADSDTYGNASSTDIDCDQPTGFVADDTDCDDTDGGVYPGARERLNGTDDDCDTVVDEAYWVGTGADGDLSLSTEFDLSSDTSGSRTDADGVAYNVSSISGADVTVDSTVSGIAAGDEVLILNAHGSDAAHTNVGVYEFAEVSSVSGAVVTLTASVSNTFGETSNADLTDQTLVLQRVPNYADVTISSGGLLTTAAWDGSTGGVVAFRASGTVLVESGGEISASELGYAGGETGSAYNCDAFQGESYAGEGEGDGDGACTSYNEYWGQYVANYGGGGAHITGAGGNYGGGATDGDSWTGGSATPPSAGDTYGSADLSSLFFGSGGGGVWYGLSSPGAGGDGGGVVYIAAFDLETQDTDAITSWGGTTTAWATGSWTYGAGGGAGGSIWLIADSMTLATDSVAADGGFGQASYTRVGGDGGEGRVRVDYNDINGVTAGATGASTEEAAVCEPDPGYSATP